MKIIEALTYIFQYANYQMAEWDNGLWKGMSKSWLIPSDMKIVFLFGVGEMGIVAALYSVIYQTVMARPVYIPSNPILLIVLCIFGLASSLLTKSILGPSSRTKHYRTIFNAWDKKKRLRWNLYLWLVVLLSWAVWIYTIRK